MEKRKYSFSRENSAGAVERPLRRVYVQGTGMKNEKKYYFSRLIRMAVFFFSFYFRVANSSMNAFMSSSIQSYSSCCSLKSMSFRTMVFMMMKVL